MKMYCLKCSKKVKVKTAGYLPGVQHERQYLVFECLVCHEKFTILDTEMKIEEKNKEEIEIVEIFKPK